MKIKPSVFLIGVQKSATTSLYDWISQHPDVCAPVSMKDTPFFIDDRLYNQGFQFIENIYDKYYNNEEIILNGSAHAIYFEKSIKRIVDYNNNAKVIVVLRNPVERAISSYNFAVKRNLDTKDLLTSINEEPERLKSDDIQILCETTYVDHGRYYKQLTVLKKHIKDENILILFYDDIKINQIKVIKDVYKFIGVDSQFEPKFKRLNKTGTVRFNFIKNIIYNNSRLKTFLLKNILNRIISYDLKYKIKLAILNFITDKNVNEKTNNRNDLVSYELKIAIYNLLKDDILNLEKLTGKDLSNWKYVNKDAEND